MFGKTLIHPRFRILGAVAAAILTLLPPAAVAEDASPSELLEEAVYQEETVGDLDAAIEIYQRIVDDAEARRGVAVRALYRLYRCYEEQGETVQAKLALTRLRQKYPDYEQLVGDEAEEVPRALGLAPVPWPDDEVQVLAARLPGGAELGPLVLAVHPAVVAGEEIWRIKALRYYGALEQGSNFVEVRRADLIPIRSHLEHSQTGRLDIEFLPEKVLFHTLGKRGTRERTVKTGRPVFDFEERFYLFRVLPLEVGYKTRLPVITAFGDFGEMAVKVTSREQVEVPAGTFDCFRLTTPSVDQTFFISSGPRRELVKIEAGGIYVELVETLKRRPEQGATYRYPDLGFSVTVPAGWHAYRRLAGRRGEPGPVQLLDPRAQLFSWVEVFALPQGSQPTLEALAEDAIRESRGQLAHLEVRDESRHRRQVDGRPAIGWISDYKDRRVPMVRHETLVVGTPHGLKLIFMSPVERFEELRATFDEIAGSLVIR